MLYSFEMRNKKQPIEDKKMTKQEIINEVYETCNSYNHYSVIVVWREGTKWNYENGYKISDCIDSDRYRNDPDFEGFGEYRIFHRDDDTTKKDIKTELEYFG